ncbi:hypothetical protein TNCV_3822111 [Trichonephila clavipes]|nr:hypothetical protein TNCV_3822111 [Trichonephila clavipes]
MVKWSRGLKENIITKEGTSSDKISKGENSAAVEKTTTIPIKPAKDVTEKENTFPTTTKDKANVGSKHRVDKKRKENITRKEKFANGTKDHLKWPPKEPSPPTANYEKNKGLVQKQERNDASPPSISAGKNSVQEGKSPVKIAIKYVKAASVEEATSIPKKPVENFTEKERTISRGTKEKTSSRSKRRSETKEGKKITKKHKHKKDLKEHQNKSSFVVSHEQPSPVAPNFGKYYLVYLRV